MTAAARKSLLAAPALRRLILADRRPLILARHRLVLPWFMPVVPPRFVVAGSQVVTASGNFTVPEYNWLAFWLYGAGGEGGAYSGGTGGPGGATTIVSLGLTANGGAGGTYAGPGIGGAGGTASGGDTNTTGAAGANGSGTAGTSATGGAGGGSSGNGAGGVDSAPANTVNDGVAGAAATNVGMGGGGEGNAYYATSTKTNNYYAASGGGGGQGGLCVKTYTRGAGGAPVPGDVLALVIGAGGTGRTKGGDGYRGQINISWS